MTQEELKNYSDLNNKFNKRCAELVKILAPLSYVFADADEAEKGNSSNVKYQLYGDEVQCASCDSRDYEWDHEYFPSFLLFMSDEDVYKYLEDRLREKREKEEAYRKEIQEKNLALQRLEYERLKKLFE